METKNSNLSLVTMSDLQKKIAHKPLDDIVREIEDQMLVRTEELEILGNMLRNYPGQQKQGAFKSEKLQPVNKSGRFPNYPMRGTLLEKFEFLEQIHMRMWSKSEIENLIKEAEGDEVARKTIKNISGKLANFAKENNLIKLQYGEKSRWNCFYTTNMNWLHIVNVQGKDYYAVLPQHAPLDSSLINVTNEMKQPEKLVFSGIEI